MKGRWRKLYTRESVMWRRTVSVVWIAAFRFKFVRRDAVAGYRTIVKTAKAMTIPTDRMAILRISRGKVRA